MKKKSIKKHYPNRSNRWKTDAKKVRIGYISDAFGAGLWRDFLTVFCAGHDPQSFEVYAYHTGHGGDTKLFAEAVYGFRELGEVALDEAVRIIRKDALDILVDISPHTPQDRILEILEHRPARHIVSLAEECPPEIAAPLPKVAENQGGPTYCYAPVKPLTDYVYRAPILDSGIPEIGFIGHVHEGMRDQVLALLQEILARIPRVRLTIPAAFAEGLTAEDFARIGEMGTETAELHLVDEPVYELLDLVIGVGTDLSDICHTAERGIPLLTAQS